MLNIFVEHAEELHFLSALKSFDDESVIMAEEEKTSARARAFTGFEDHLTVLFGVKRCDNVFGINLVKLHDLLELVLVVTSDRRAYFDLNRSLLVLLCRVVSDVFDIDKLLSQ